MPLPLQSTCGTACNRNSTSPSSPAGAPPLLPGKGGVHSFQYGRWRSGFHSQHLRKIKIRRGQLAQVLCDTHLPKPRGPF